MSSFKVWFVVDISRFQKLFYVDILYFQIDHWCKYFGFLTVLATFLNIWAILFFNLLVTLPGRF